jgi:cell wall-associated NlpC family hydrolase
MYKKHLYLLFILLHFTSCFVKKKTTYANQHSRTISVSANAPEHDLEPDSLGIINEANAELNTTVEELPKLPKADAIINTALTFSGVRYRYGGTTRKGMDCSGLLYVSFQEHDVPLPRVSKDMAEKGKKIKLSKVNKGDLLFFKTSRNGGRINHVGLVVEVEGDEIKFVHSTKSRGVIVSSLREGYWNSAFVKATRIL